MGNRRLIDVETLKQGAALLEEHRAAERGFSEIRRNPFATSGEFARAVNTTNTAREAWLNWAAMHAGPIMDALTAYAALEEILDHTHITELIWWTDPGVWGLRTDADQTGEDEGNWTDPTLTGVLRAAAADFAAADELEDAERDRELAFEADAPPEVDRG